MTKIIIGLIFIVFNLNIELPFGSLGIMPDFVGYILLFSGLKTTQHDSKNFENAKKICPPLVVYSLAVYVFGLLSINLGFVSNILTAISTLANFYITYSLCMGFIDIEKNNSCKLEAQSLFGLWKFYAIIIIASYFLNLTQNKYITALTAIATLFSAVTFVLKIHKTKRLYDEFLNQN